MQVLDKAKAICEESPLFLQCVACQTPIVVPTCDIRNRPILWHLACCCHPLHLDCLAPLGCPHAMSPSTKCPRYVHDPGVYLLGSPILHCLYICFLSSYENLKPETAWAKIQSPPCFMLWGCGENEGAQRRAALRFSSPFFSMETSTLMFMAWWWMVILLMGLLISDVSYVHSYMSCLELTSFHFLYVKSN